MNDQSEECLRVLPVGSSHVVEGVEYHDFTLQDLWMWEDKVQLTLTAKGRTSVLRITGCSLITVERLAIGGIVNSIWNWPIAATPAWLADKYGLARLAKDFDIAGKNIVHVDGAYGLDMLAICDAISAVEPDALQTRIPKIMPQ